MSNHDTDDELNLREIAGQWQSQPVDTRIDFEQAARMQRRRRRLFYADMLSAVVMLGAAVLFLSWEITVLTMVSAAVLVGSAIIMTRATLSIHRQVQGHADWSTPGLLEFRRVSTRASIRYARLNQMGCAVILAFTGLLLILAKLMPGTVPEELTTAYLLLAPLVVVLAGYLERRVRRLKKELEAIDTVAREFEAAG